MKFVLTNRPIAGFSLEMTRIVNDFPEALLYNVSMRKAPLSKTNPYINNAEKRKELLLAFVDSSSAIEGIHVSSLKKKKPRSKPTRAAVCHEAEESYEPRR